MHLFMYSQVKPRPRNTPTNMPAKTATGRLIKPTTESLGLGAMSHQATTMESTGHAKTQADWGRKIECQKPLPDSNHARVAMYQPAGSAPDTTARNANLMIADVDRLLDAWVFKSVTRACLCGLTFDLSGLP